MNKPNLRDRAAIRRESYAIDRDKLRSAHINKVNENNHNTFRCDNSYDYNINEQYDENKMDLIIDKLDIIIELLKTFNNNAQQTNNTIQLDNINRAPTGALNPISSPMLSEIRNTLGAVSPIGEGVNNMQPMNQVSTLTSLPPSSYDDNIPNIVGI